MSDKRSRDLSDPSYVEPCNHEVGRTITCRLGTYGCSIHDAESPAPPVREPTRQVSCTECDGDGCAKCRPDEICAECLDYFANHPKYGSVSTCDHRGPTPVSEVERLREALRHEWWCHHGCQGIPYGDDGEMQCCGIDFKRAMFEKLRETVALLRMQAAKRAADALKESSDGK